MVAFLRRFLIVLLVLLQYAAPLVHAHASGSSSLRGLHLHEFEALRLQVNDGLSLSSSDLAAETESGIIEIGSAIKHQQTTVAVSSPLFRLDDTPGFDIARDAEIINFSPQPVGAITKPYLRHNPSRAPPL